jgi:hypothetical protein
VGTRGEDHRPMTHSRKSAAQRAKSLERLRTFRERKEQEEVTPPKPYVPSSEFAAAYAMPHNEIGPVGMQWREGDRHPTWALPVHTITYTPRRAYTPRITPNI